MRVHVAFALVLCGGLLSGCGGAGDATSTRQPSETSSVAATECPARMTLGEYTTVSWSPVSNELAISDGGNDLATASDIWVLDTDTCEVSKATEGIRADWSPDGQKLVFSRGEGLFTANDDGSDVEQITVTRMDEAGVGDWDFSPKWSPRGDLISFLHEVSLPPYGDDYILSLAVVRPDGSSRRQVAELNGYTSISWMPRVAPRWSADGRRTMVAAPDLRWINVRDGRSELDELPPVVKIEPPVPPLALLDASFAPDGRLIALAVASNEKDDVYGVLLRRPGRIMLVPASGGRRRPLLRPPPGHGDSSPSWSRDGRIAFVRGDGLESEIYVVRTDGSGLRRLTAPAPAAK